MRPFNVGEAVTLTSVTLSLSLSLFTVHKYIRAKLFVLFFVVRDKTFSYRHFHELFRRHPECVAHGLGLRGWLLLPRRDAFIRRATDKVINSGKTMVLAISRKERRCSGTRIISADGARAKILRREQRRVLRAQFLGDVRENREGKLSGIFKSCARHDWS